MGTDNQTTRSQGFSLAELLVVVAMISFVMVAILAQVDQVQQRATTELGRVDDFQQARDFIAQVVREGRAMGYPNVHNFDTSSGTWQITLMNDPQVAIGLIKLTSTELDFEGDVDGTGIVSIVSYKLNGDGNCAKCMERVQIRKLTGNPLTQANGISANSYVQEVRNVQNGSSTAAPIFAAYDATGASVLLPLDITSSAANTAKVRLIKVNLAVASPTSTDAKTGRQLEADLSGNVQVVNCSMATTGVTTSSGFQLTCQ
jgi:prepilin-type N-terminal cleavage/methylation domain-containing protein